jgi:CPA2 family monovalent cation:H+ antiporter-2
MHGASELLAAITVVLTVAAVTTVACQRLRQPVVLGYILAGLIVGPHVPIPVFADQEIIQVLSELGVILLMFSLGLEFSLRKLIQVGPTAGLTALIQSSLMVWIGFLVGRAFGWTALESVYAGAIIAISSTTIIAKAFDELAIHGALRQLVIGILIVEDLIAVLLMAILTTLSSGEDVSLAMLAASGGRLAAFLVGLVAVGMLVVPRTIRATTRLQRRETTLVVSVGVCFAIAHLAHELGYSVALGAFIAGALVAESGEGKGIEQLILPVRDMFAAIFFVSVGMLIDPRLIVQHWIPVAVLSLVVVLGKILSVTLGAFLTGNGTRTSLQAGMSLAQIGEFSFIIAALGIALGATREFLYPVAVAVSALTTLTTPGLIRRSGRAAIAFDRLLPRPLQTYSALYGTWIEQLRSSAPTRTEAARIKRLAGLLLLDVVVLTGLVIASAIWTPSLAQLAAGRLGLSPGLIRGLTVLLAIALAAPFSIGVYRIVRGLGVALAQTALPTAGKGAVDLAAAPRRALVVTLQLLVVLAVGVPVLALTQPFLPRWVSMAPVLLGLVLLAIAFWRSALNLQGHVKAGAQVVFEVLMSQGHRTPPGPGASASFEQLMPGLGAPTALALHPGDAAVGASLAELGLRGRTGASVLVIARGEEGVVVPRADEILRAGDVLALVGTQESIAAATAILKAGVGRPGAEP